jgi:hypothetical protein
VPYVAVLSLGIFSLIACFFLPWFDDRDYYQIAYGVDGLFEFMIQSIRWITLGSGALTIALIIAAQRIER